MILLWLYARLATLATLLLRLHLRRRVAAGREIAERVGERRGIDPTPRPAGILIWLHAASVGETLSILPVIEALLRTPTLSVLVTSGTRTSAELLSARRYDLAGGERVLHRFVPLDVPAWTRRFVDHWRPNVAGFVESELWPNLLLACADNGIPLMLVNARLSERSFRGWQRAGGVAGRLLSLFAAVQAQTEADGGRLSRLGATRVACPGNLKFAAAPLPFNLAELNRLGDVLIDRPVWLAASTHPGEEALIATVHRRLAVAHPGLVTILAPRHPERGAAIAAELGGITLTRRGLQQDPPTGGIWLADTIGELGMLYRLAPIVFVGRSLRVGGGQNPIEPARLGCAVAVGPRTENFAEAVAVLKACGALMVVEDAEALGRWVDAMLRDPMLRQATGQAGIAATQRAAQLPAEVAAILLSLIGATA